MKKLEKLWYIVEGHYNCNLERKGEGEEILDKGRGKKWTINIPAYYRVLIERIYGKRGERERGELAFREREERKLVKSFLEREKKGYREIEQI